jgi:hypothetical protein
LLIGTAYKAYINFVVPRNAGHDPPVTILDE